MTFSIVARSFDPPMFGVAIASSSPAVAARCAHARAGAGAAATQNITDPRLGPAVLECLAHGGGAQPPLEAALRSTPFAGYRQLLAIGAAGAPAVHSGARALGLAASAIGAHAAAAGNLLAHADVPAAMIGAFEAASGHLAARLAARAGRGCRARRGGRADSFRGAAGGPRGAVAHRRSARRLERRRSGGRAPP